MRFGIIYIATNTINGKCYIGQSIQSISDRRSKHYYESRKVGHYGYGIYFHKALRKYKETDWLWEILYNQVPEHLLGSTERFAIANYNTLGASGYNSTPGGEESPSKNPEVAKKISKSLTGRKMTKETREKVSKNNAR
jgi:hypothetical protein